MPMIASLILSLSLAPFPAQAAAPGYDSAAKEVRAILAELVAADTSNPPGNEARAAAIGARYLKEAGIPYEVVEFSPGRANLVARLKGKGSEKPLLLLAHTDVVGTGGQTWSSKPHVLTEAGGYLVGRGSADDLGMAATALETLLLLKRTGAELRRDVIMAWTGDEEVGGTGIQHLLKNRRDLIDAGIAINEGASIFLDEKGKVYLANMQVAEKMYRDFELVARGTTGHSSMPVKDNAIYRLAAALDRLGKHRFPARLLPITRAYFAERSAHESPEIAAAMRKIAESQGELPAEALAVIDEHPSLSAFLRTTCVATMLSGGTGANALPPEAKAIVNCRILPDEEPKDVDDRITQVVNDPAVEVRLSWGMPKASPPSPMDGEGPAALRKIVGQMWPGVAVIPVLEKGATDSAFLRSAGIPAYGILPTALNEADRRRMHGIDERIPVASMRSGIEFLHRLTLELAARP